MQKSLFLWTHHFLYGPTSPLQNQKACFIEYYQWERQFNDIPTDLKDL